MNSMIPTIKKRVNSFLLAEEGKISKKNLLRTGTVLAGVSGLVISSAAVLSHQNHFTGSEDGCVGHTSHGSHSSHSSHGSHASHSSHSNHAPCPCGY
ncbi:MAG: hypothetical protein ACQESF_01555 [Nanobdellota archaeon]